jgi:hypothetical protein
MMGYAELIEKLQNLPADKQSEVVDFVEFLASRTSLRDAKSEVRSQSTLAEWRAHPLTVRDFSPMSRDEANAR